MAVDFKPIDFQAENASIDFKPIDFQAETSPQDSGNEDWISRGMAKIAPLMPSMPSLSVDMANPVKSAIKSGMETFGFVPSTDPAEIATGVLAAPAKVYNSLQPLSDKVSEAATQGLENMGATKGYAALGGMVAGAPFDPTAIALIGPAAKLAKVGKLAAAGELAAEKAAGSLVARTGEELVQEVTQAAKAGDIAKLDELVSSGKTHLYYSEALKQDITKTKDIASKVDQLAGIKSSLEARTSVPLATRGNVLKLKKIEDDLGAFLATPQETKALDKMISRRDALAQKNFTSPSYEREAALKRLNKEIQTKVKETDMGRVERISQYRQRISDTEKALAGQQESMIRDVSGKIIRNESQIEKAKAGISKKLSAPIEEDIVRGMLGVTNDSSFFSNQIRSPMQGLTFIADTLDKHSNGAFSRYVIKPQLEAEAKWDAARTAAVKSIEDVQAKAAIPPEHSQNLRMFIENKAPAPAGLEANFQAAKKDYGELMRNAGNKYNQLADEFGIPKVDMSRFSNDDYVFNTKRTNALWDLNDMDIRDIPKDAMFTKHNDLVPDSVKHRYDAIPEEQLEGAFEAGEKYLLNVGKVEAFGDMIKRYRSLARTARSLDRPTLAKQFDGLADRLTGDAAKTSAVAAEKATGGAATPRLMRDLAVMSGIFAKNAVNSAGAAIGNIGSMVTNAIYMGPSRATMSVFEGASKNLFEHAYQSFVNPEYQLLARKYSKVIPVHGYEPPLRFAERNASKAVQTARLYQNVVESFRSYMNESMNIGTWNQAFKAARASGYSFEQATKTADNIVMRTQAMYREAFRPSVIGAGSPIGKLVAPLSTYVFNAANAIGQDVLFSEMPMRQKVQALAGAYTAGVLANVITQTLANKPKVNTADFIPFFRQAQYGIGGALGTPAEVVKDVMKGKPGTAALRGFSYLSPLGSAQIMNTVQGARSVLQGKTEGAIPSAQALVFGPARGKNPK